MSVHPFDRSQVITPVCSGLNGQITDSPEAAATLYHSTVSHGDADVFSVFKDKQIARLNLIGGNIPADRCVLGSTERADDVTQCMVVDISSEIAAVEPELAPVLIVTPDVWCSKFAAGDLKKRIKLSCVAGAK